MYAAHDMIGTALRGSRTCQHYTVQSLTETLACYEPGVRACTCNHGPNNQQRLPKVYMPTGNA